MQSALYLDFDSQALISKFHGAQKLHVVSRVSNFRTVVRTIRSSLTGIRMEVRCTYI